MKRKNPTPAPKERPLPPSLAILEHLAKLPEDVQQLALGYGYGLMVGRKLKDA
jgi:hypothetical protein